MDAYKRSWYSMSFKVKWYELKGNAFQEFFYRIMESCHPGDFIRVRPYGNEGDWKNDGYLSSEKTVFQVYAPEEMLKAASAINKIDTDFHGATHHWGSHMANWVFVHNDNRGLPPQVLAKLLDLGAEQNQVTIGSWGQEEIRNKLFSLNEEKIVEILGQAPERDDIMSFKFTDLQVVINNVAKRTPLTSKEIRPVPSDKIEINGIGPDVEEMLKNGMRRVNFIGEFFDKWYDPLLGERVASSFKQRYEELKIQHIPPDTIFMQLWKDAGGSTRPNISEESAVLAVLAYLFERCDIFESFKGGVVI